MPQRAPTEGADLRACAAALTCLHVSSAHTCLQTVCAKMGLCLPVGDTGCIPSQKIPHAHVRSNYASRTTASAEPVSFKDGNLAPRACAHNKEAHCNEKLVHTTGRSPLRITRKPKHSEDPAYETKIN